MPESAPENPPPPRWKRYKLPVNRKDRVGRPPTEPDGSPARSNRGLRALLITVGLVVGLPIVGCLILFWLFARAVR